MNLCDGPVEVLTHTKSSRPMSGQLGKHPLHRLPLTEVNQAQFFQPTACIDLLAQELYRQ